LSPWHGAYSDCGWREGLQIRRVATNILNKQSWTADKGWSSSLGLTTPHRKKNFVVTKCFKAKKLHNNELHDLYSSPNIVRVIKARRMRWPVHVACRGRGEIFTGFWLGGPKGRRREESISGSDFCFKNSMRTH